MQKDQLQLDSVYNNSLDFVHSVMLRIVGVLLETVLDWRINSTYFVLYFITHFHFHTVGI